MKIRTLTTFLYLTLAGGLFASPQGNGKGTLRGTVLDAKTNEPLPGVQIVVEGTFFGTTTAADGSYELTLPAGSYTIVARMLGYARQVRKVTVRAGTTVVLRFRLTETVLRAPEVVVTASKRYQSVQDTPVSVSILSTEDILTRNYQNLDEFLAVAPGVTLVNNQINIRGSSGYNMGAGSRVLFLVDGVPMMPGDSGDIKWDVIPVDQVERVEVVKGAGSALYGSSALGGVVNVATREPGDVPETTFRTLLGVFDRPPYSDWRWTDRWLHFSEWSVSHSRRVGPVGMLASLKRSESTGYRQNGYYSRWNGFLKLTSASSANNRLDLTLAGSTDSYGSNLMWPDQSRALEVAPEALGDHIRSGKLHAAFQWRKVQSRRLAFRLRLSSFANNWTDYFHDSHDYSRARTLGTEFQTDYLLANKHPLTVGLETRFDRVRANIFGRRKAKDLAGYVQLEWHFSNLWLANFGVRQDFHWRDGTSVERQLSPKLGIVWHYLPSGTFRAAVGSGFRAASIAEAYSQTFVSGIQVRPNPDLKAERGWTAELGITQRFGDLAVSASVFYDRFHDLIEPQADVTNTVRFANVTEARLQGAEFGLQGAGRIFKGTGRLSVNYVYLDTRDLSLDEPLAYRARHTLQNSFSWRRGRLTLGLDYRYVSRIERVQIYWRDERVPQKVLDLRVAWDTDIGALTLEVDNALNYAYTQIERNLQPIRSFRLSFRTRF